jgi:hypothetical protein
VVHPLLQSIRGSPLQLEILRQVRPYPCRCRRLGTWKFREGTLVIFTLWKAASTSKALTCARAACDLLAFESGPKTDPVGQIRLKARDPSLVTRSKSPLNSSQWQIVPIIRAGARCLRNRISGICLGINAHRLTTWTRLLTRTWTPKASPSSNGLCDRA